MCERHIPRAELIEFFKRVQRFFDAVSALDSDQRCDLAFLMNAVDVVGRKRESECLWVARDHPLDQIDLLEGCGKRFAAITGLDWYPHAPKLRSNTASA